MISDIEVDWMTTRDDVDGIQAALTADAGMANQVFTVEGAKIIILPVAIDRRSSP